MYKIVRDIPKGLSGDEVIDGGYAQAATIPAEFDPPTSIKSIDDIRGKVAVTDFATGQILVDGMFVAPTG